MKKLTVLIAGALVALTATSVAVATKFRAENLSQTTASFRVERDWSKLRTCTGNGDTFQIGRAQYKGSIDFADAQNELDGPFVLRVHWVYNQTAKHGYADLWWRAKDTADVDQRRAQGWGRAVLGAGSGNAVALDGFVDGRVSHQAARLLGGLSANLLPNEAGEFTVVEGTIGNAANAFPAEIVGRPCVDSKPERPRPGVKIVVKGEISTLDATTVGVKPRDNSPEQKCVLRSGVSPSTSGLAVGDKVEMTCVSLANGSTFENVVLRLNKRR